MQGKAVYKVEGGKLIKVILDYTGDVIDNAVITGDFFMHPEESITGIEAQLEGTRLEDAEEKIRDYARKNDIIFFGVDAESIAHTLKMAVK